MGFFFGVVVWGRGNPSCNTELVSVLFSSFSHAHPYCFQVFKARDALMSRANSLKKAVRQIIEHTEKGEWSN